MRQTFASAETALKEIYGYDSFRGVQKKAIDAALNGNDVFVLMATGGGKSLCYIIPPLVCGKIAVVVSPLVSLMQDQVRGLTEHGVSACFLGSAQSDPTIWHSLNSFQLIYVTPEMTTSSRFRAILPSLDIAFLAVDEAHCVSEWGHDFRPEYRQICDLRQIVHAPMVAVTATATPDCQLDIVRHLNIRGPSLITTVDRPNLIFTVVDKPKCALRAIQGLLPSSGSVIVYVPTIKETDDVSAALMANGVSCAKYHAGCALEERRRVHSAFSNDQIQVVVATLAFGMGVDKPDVRTVIHWGMPKTIEAYYQQAGRAGRDGDDAQCILFHGPADYVVAKRLVGEDSRALKGLNAMRHYCDAYSECRRKVLVRYFGEDLLTCCGRCDICTDESEKKDISRHARSFLNATSVCASRCGITTIISLLRGNVKHDWLKSASVYGQGKDLSVDQWREIYTECRAAGLIEENTRTTTAGHAYAAVNLTNSGKEWLSHDDAVLLGRASQKAAAKLDTCENDLFSRLKAIRQSLAQRLPPYMVCSNDSLRQLALQKPRTEAELLKISGFGHVKVRKYGTTFLEAIAKSNSSARF